MLQVNAPIDVIIKAIGEQRIINDNYRVLTYIQSCNVDNGLLIYNLMTRELLLLNKNEILDLEKIDMRSKTVQDLIKKWFLVPEVSDDYLLFKQTDSLFHMLIDNANNSPLHNFVIYPTTDCNARCFYCFELSCKRITMSENTAHDVAKFIINKSQGHKVHIMWFGGEPLYNSKAIDIICADLTENNIKYDSEMVSNGYLFDENTIKRASEFWKLNKIQITLDGTEKVYNKTKAYIYKDDCSPFNRVLDNIELLLISNIYVSIRLNMDIYNSDDLRKLIEQLLERFERYSNYQIYISLLFEKNGKKYTPRSRENKEFLNKKCDELNKIIESRSRLRKYDLSLYRTAKQCMADNNASTTILPDGSLGKCEHFTDDNYYGSIYSDKIENYYIEKFKKRTDFGEKCHTCPLQPKCMHLQECPNVPAGCDDFDRELNIKYLKEQMIASYEYYLSSQKPTENSSESVIQTCD